MKIIKSLLCVALLAWITTVDCKSSNQNEQQTKTSVLPSAVKSTTPPITASSVAPKISSSSTKTAPTVKVASKSNGNAAKKSVAKPSTSVAVSDSKVMEVKPTEKIASTTPKDMELKPISTPDTFVYEKSTEIKKTSSPTKAMEAKPLAVTGFITQNGSIYEIEDKDGIGKIEGRQNGEVAKEHVCNYGSVVVYSDIPCDNVADVRVSEVQEKPSEDQKPNDVMQNEELNDEVNKKNDKDNQVRTRPNSKKPRRKTKNKIRKQQNIRRYNSQRVVSRPYRQQNRSKRRSQQKKRQPLRVQQYNRRQQYNHRRRVNSRPKYYDDYEDEVFEYSRGQDY